MVKKIILFVSILCAFISCKKKNDETELGKNETSQYPPHCFNKIKDSDEIGIDCGGSCEPCSNTPATPSCTVTANKIIINNVTYTANMGGSSSSTYYSISGSYGNTGYYELKLKAAPDETKAYTIKSTLPDQSTDAYMEVSYNLSTLYLTSGKVYFQNNGSSYTAVVCSGSGVQSNLTIPVKANFTFQ